VLLLLLLLPLHHTPGHAYPCFCTDAELEAMKAEAEAKKLPPIYRCEQTGVQHKQ
jgi:glutamyl/glutaminyl-tRNA synthetase